MVLFGRIASVGPGPNITNLDSEDFDIRFEAAWAAIVEQHELACASSGIRLPALAKPQALILDVRNKTFLSGYP